MILPVHQRGREMNIHGEPIMIHMADDDAGDRMLTKRAFDRSHLANELRFVEDGEELLQFLRHEAR